MNPELDIRCAPLQNLDDANEPDCFYGFNVNYKIILTTLTKIKKFYKDRYRYDSQTGILYMNNGSGDMFFNTIEKCIDRINFEKHHPFVFHEDVVDKFREELKQSCNLILKDITCNDDCSEYYYEFENFGNAGEKFTISEFEKDSITRNILDKIEKYWDDFDEQQYEKIGV